MATIYGSQYSASGVNPTLYPNGVNVVVTDDGLNGINNQPLGSDTLSGYFNLEVYEGPAAGAPSTPFAGYQALSIVGINGYSIELLGSGYAITDSGSGDTLTTSSTATGDTIIGGSHFSNLIVNGSGNTAVGGAGGNYIEVDGTGNTVTGGSGNDAINVNASGNTINLTGATGSDTITIESGANGVVVTGGTGPDTITALGNDESITGGAGADLVNATGSGDTITAGSGGGTFNVFATGDTVIGGTSGSDTVGLYANGDVFTGGAASGTVITTGTTDVVNAGAGNLDVIKAAGVLQFNDDSSAQYQDTIVGFSQAAGDRVQLAGSDAVASAVVQPNGQDLLITLTDNSTILLKGVTSDAGIFN